MAFSKEVLSRITQENLRSQEVDFTTLLECRFSHISDLVGQVLSPLRQGGDFQSILQSSSPILPIGDMAPHQEALPEHREPLYQGLRSLSRLDKCAFCTLLPHHAKRLGVTPSLSDFLPFRDGFDKVACAKNEYVTTAYTELLSDMASPLFCNTYEEAIHLIHTKEADACLIPFRDSLGNPVRAFREQLREDELFVSQVVTVTDRGGVPMELALCSRYLLPLWENPTWMLALPNAQSLGDTLDALTYFGFRVTSLYAENAVSISAMGGDPIPLMLWLTLFYPDVKVVGSYEQN